MQGRIPQTCLVISTAWQRRGLEGQDFDNIQTDQNPGESGCVDPAQGPGRCLMKAAEILMICQVWEAMEWDGLRICLWFGFGLYQVTEHP